MDKTGQQHSWIGKPTATHAVSCDLSHKGGRRDPNSARNPTSDNVCYVQFEGEKHRGKRLF